MLKWLKRFFKTLPAFIMGTIMFAAGTPPDSAVSNLSKWAELVGINLPNILKQKIADVWVFWICLIGIILYIVFMIFLRIHKKKTKKKPKSETVYFSHLNSRMLKEWAKRLRDKYQDLPIISITLHPSHVLYDDPIKKYLIIILVDPSIENSPELNERYEELLGAPAWLNNIPDSNSARDLCIDANFVNVYKEKPENMFLNEWDFYVDKDEISNLPKGEKITLYQSKLK